MKKVTICPVRGDSTWQAPLLGQAVSRGLASLS